MAQIVKNTVKKALATMGLINPALGIKISPQAKAEFIAIMEDGLFVLNSKVIEK